MTINHVPANPIVTSVERITLATYTCNIQPNTNFCGTCNKMGYRTAASTCPLRPTTGKSFVQSKIYRAPPNINSKTDFPNLSEKTDGQKENNFGDEDKDDHTQNGNEFEIQIKKLLQDHMDKMAKWILSIITLIKATEPEQIAKINQTIKAPSEEFLQRHFNIIQSIDGHIHVGIEDFNKKEKNNKPISQTEETSNGYQ